VLEGLFLRDHFLIVVKDMMLGKSHSLTWLIYDGMKTRTVMRTMRRRTVRTKRVAMSIESKEMLVVTIVVLLKANLINMNMKGGVAMGKRSRELPLCMQLGVVLRIQVLLR
jgi:hypothetical protein